MADAKRDPIKLYEAADKKYKKTVSDSQDIFKRASHKAHVELYKLLEKEHGADKIYDLDKEHWDKHADKIDDLAAKHARDDIYKAVLGEGKDEVTKKLKDAKVDIDGIVLAAYGIQDYDSLKDIFKAHRDATPNLHSYNPGQMEQILQDRQIDQAISARHSDMRTAGLDHTTDTTELLKYSGAEELIDKSKVKSNSDLETILNVISAKKRSDDAGQDFDLLQLYKGLSRQQQTSKLLSVKAHEKFAGK